MPSTGMFGLKARPSDYKEALTAVEGKMKSSIEEQDDTEEEEEDDDEEEKEDEKTKEEEDADLDDDDMDAI